MNSDTLREEIVKLRKLRDSHQFDESEYIDNVMAAIKDHVDYVIDTKAPDGVDETCEKLLKETQRNRAGAY